MLEGFVNGAELSGEAAGELLVDAVFLLAEDALGQEGGVHGHLALGVGLDLLDFGCKELPFTHKRPIPLIHHLPNTPHKPLIHIQQLSYLPSPTTTTILINLIQHLKLLDPELPSNSR